MSKPIIVSHVLRKYYSVSLQLESLHDLVFFIDYSCLAMQSLFALIQVKRSSRGKIYL